MLGLLFMGIFVLYLIISLVVIVIGIKQAKNRGYNGWQGGLLAAFIMYNLLFWDLIPVYAVHDYQCENNAGFTVYKTLEQWEAENPEVVKTLVPAIDSNRVQTKNTIQYQLNQRFIKRVHYEKIWHIVRKTDEKIIDTKTDETMAQYIDFSANIDEMMDFKIWFESKTCEIGPWPRERIQFNGFTTNIEKLGSYK